MKSLNCRHPWGGGSRDDSKKIQIEIATGIQNKIKMAEQEKMRKSKETKQENNKRNNTK